jgi:hypothetical protein
MTPIAEAALKNAISQIGVTEKPLGSNSGPEVNQYLKSVDLDPGYSWCAAFVYWCFNKASYEMSVINPVFRTGGVLNMWGMCKNNRSSVPSPGDIFIMDHGHGLGHAGIIESIDGSTLHTIEGNSNNNGSRNGVAVVRHTRAIGDPQIKGYLRF